MKRIRDLTVSDVWGLGHTQSPGGDQYFVTHRWQISADNDLLHEAQIRSFRKIQTLQEFCRNSDWE